jgi:hypothetical protein
MTAWLKRLQKLILHYKDYRSFKNYGNLAQHPSAESAFSVGTLIRATHDKNL